jgi:hypothetical protein
VVRTLPNGARRDLALVSGLWRGSPFLLRRSRPARGVLRRAWAPGSSHGLGQALKPGSGNERAPASPGGGPGGGAHLIYHSTPPSAHRPRLSVETGSVAAAARLRTVVDTGVAPVEQVAFRPLVRVDSLKAEGRRADAQPRQGTSSSTLRRGRSFVSPRPSRSRKAGGPDERQGTIRTRTGPTSFRSSTKVTTTRMTEASSLSTSRPTVSSTPGPSKPGSSTSRTALIERCLRGCPRARPMSP